MKIRYCGHIGRLSGYGRAGADLCMALLSTGEVDLEIAPIAKPAAPEARVALERYEPLRACLRHDHELTAPDILIVHTLPQDCTKVLDRANVDPEVPCVAYTTWEALSMVPEPIGIPLADFDQLWVPSSATARACGGENLVRALLDRFLHVVPHAFDPATLEERRREITRTGSFTFYYSGAWNSRKNPAGILRAWAMAFSNTDTGVRLKLHCPGAHPEQFALALAQTGLSSAKLAPIDFDNKVYTESEYLELHRMADCFVTATRGEAWNLPAFDAMLAGRHVIHPAGMGSDDYLKDTSANLIGGMAMPATVDVMVTERMADGQIKIGTVGAQGLSSRSTWLEPDLVRLAETMANIYRFKRRDLVVNYDPVERYGYPAVGKLALAALEDL